MNETKNLDFLIQKRFRELCSEIKPSDKKYINPKSLENFILYLVEKPQINPKRNKTLQELGEIRMKKTLLEFFHAVEIVDLNNQKAAELYDQYIIKIGEFMREYYGFTGNGGKLKVLTILIILTAGIFLDTVFVIFRLFSYPFFTPMFITLFSTRLLIKYNQKKVYGFFY